MACPALPAAHAQPWEERCDAMRVPKTCTDMHAAMLPGRGDRAVVCFGRGRAGEWVSDGAPIILARPTQCSTSQCSGSSACPVSSVSQSAGVSSVWEQHREGVGIDSVILYILYYHVVQCVSPTYHPTHLSLP